ncbi:MAG: hypothetical protein JWM47_672 [Acidimicrobiales bacterium]|nr:hypothetical protein [Acidimicrobiales bacterium]
MSSNSHRRIARRTLAALLACLLVTTLCVSCRPPPNFRQYPLRHAFSLVPGLPGTRARMPTSCYRVVRRDYVCRLVEGYEAIGDARDFRMPARQALRMGSSRKYGAMVVRRNGRTYEGCRKVNGGRYWECDHRVSKLVSRRHYRSTKRYVLRVFWRWSSYTANQAGCAYGITALWTKASPAKLAAALNGCRNGPM